MYRFMLRHFVSRDSSVGKRISGRNLYENSISAHQSNLQQFDRSHYRKYFSSPEKWQFFEEKPLHPSLLSDVSIESDITIERGRPQISYSAQNAFVLMQNKMKEDLQKFRIDLNAAMLKDKSADKDILSALHELESSSVVHLEVGACLSCLKIIRSNLTSIEAHNALITKNLENTLVWRARNCSFKDLTMILSYCMKYQGKSVSLNERASALNSALLKEVTKSIERRWVEISDGRMFVSALHYPGIFSEQFVLKVEGRIIELAESLPSSDLIMILKCLGFKKRRSVPLLRSIAYHVTRSKDELDLITISSCLFAMKELSFRDLDFLDALSSSASRQLEIETDVQLFVLRSILQSFGQIRYRPTELLDKIAEKLVMMKNNLDEKDLITFVMTNAALNYVPKNSEEIFRIVEERLTFESLLPDPKLKKELEWLEIVWSLAILQKAKPEHFKSVLSTEFYHKLLYSHDQRNVGVLLKLLNVNAVAQTRSYDVATINVAEDPLLRDIKLTEKSDRTKLVSAILSSVESLATPPNFLSKNVNTLMGFQIDGEAIFDEKLKPVALNDYLCFSTLHNSKEKTLKDIPENCSRVAFLVTGYHDTLFGSNELTGLTSLYVKLLESQKYKVIEISHNELKPHHKNIERVKMIQQKLRSAFGSENI